MTLAAWGLVRSPFSGAGWRFFDGENQAEALARLRFVAASGLSAVVVGERGVGKTELVRRFASESRRAGRPVALVDVEGLSPREALWQAASQFALGPRADEDLPRLHRRIADYAASWTRGRRAPLVLVDNADQAGPDLRAHLLRLAAPTGGGPTTSLTFAVTHSGLARLGAELVDRLDLKVPVDPWTETETVAYIQHALVDAGCAGPAFDDEALGVLFTLSGGVPRQVSRLAEHSLLGAAAQGFEQVDAGMVEAAHDALAWTATASR